MNKNIYISPEAAMIDLDYELALATSWHDGSKGFNSLDMDQFDDIDDFA